MRWAECGVLAAADPTCSDVAYGAGAGAAGGEVPQGGCRCVLKGSECVEVTSKSRNSVYKRVCPTIPPTDGPCSHIETVNTLKLNNQMLEAQNELSALQAEVKLLKAQLAAAEQRRG